MSTVTPPQATAQSPTTRVQSLIIQLDGITAADYLTWVRDPEPPALDHGLRSIAISAEPLEALVNIELVWAGRPPTTPRAAAVAAGFPPIPEVVAVLAGPAPPTDTRRAVEARTDPFSFSEPVPHGAAVGSRLRTRC